MTEFVAWFLGASNLLDGELKEQRDRHTTVLPAGGTTVTLPSDRAPFRVGSQVRVGVRPEKITIAPDGGSEPGSGWNSVTGLLRMSTYIDVSHQYKVEGPLGAPLTVWVQNLGTGPAPSRGIGFVCRGSGSTRSRCFPRRASPWRRKRNE